MFRIRVIIHSSQTNMRPVCEIHASLDLRIGYFPIPTYPTCQSPFSYCQTLEGSRTLHAMELLSLSPLFYFLIASLLTITGLKRRRQTRVLLLGPIWLFSLMALASSHRLAWMTGADSIFASLVVFYLLYSPKTLVFDQHTVTPELNDAFGWSFVDCYRVWNNPRQLPLRLQHKRKAPNTPSKSRVIFCLSRSIKAAGLWAFEYFIFQKVFVYALWPVTVSDFAPEMESALFHRLSQHEIRVRSIISLQWIWRAYFFLEFHHSLLAIVFVGILRFDSPGEWPPLFGSPLEAYTIRGFWGRFWHQLTVPTYVFYARLASRQIVPAGSLWGKVLTALLVFTISGLSHSLVGWALGDTALFRDILFFEMCFLAAAGETAVSKIRVKEPSIFRRTFSPVFRRVAGMVWVFAFFFCAVPTWVYPKTYHYLLNPEG